ncbi:hypothetical protein [Pedobacter immunditicola]|uniref:hypothetical protein n=1 Tax=Pedobacter immunditicola TaxID=3133440 RepID=UPI00309FDAEF
MRKSTKKEKLRISIKYINDYGVVDFREHYHDLIKRYYSTNATTTQLRKLKVPYEKAFFDFSVTRGKAGGTYYKPTIGNIVRKKDLSTVDAYLQEVQARREKKN